MRVASSSAKSAAPKASRSAPKTQKADSVKRGAKLPEGVDDTPDFSDASPEPDFSDAPAQQMKAGAATRAKGGAKAGAAKATPAAPAATGAKRAAAKAAAPKGGSFEVAFTLVKETPGAGQYREVDASGKVLDMKDAYIGGLYLRKDKLPNGTLPQTAKVSVTF